MFFMLPYSIIKDMEDASIGMALVKGIIKLAGGVPLIQSVTGSTYTSHALNAVCWFLSTLFICYIFSPILIKLVKLLFLPKVMGEVTD